MKTKGKPMLIEIKTKAGTLQAVSAYDLKPKHLQRLKTILSTVAGKKKRKEMKHDLIGDLFYLKALSSLIDRTAYLSLTQKQRDKAIKHWWKASNALQEFEEVMKTFSDDSA